MEQKDFDRLNAISQRSLLTKVTPDELKEFNQLIDDWSESTEFTSLVGFNHGTNTD